MRTQSMRAVNRVALVLVAVASVLSVLEFVVLVGSGCVAAEEDRPAVEWLVRLVHLAAEVGIIAVLLRNARAIDAGRRFRTVLRLVVVGTLVAYLAFMTALSLLVPETGDLWRGAVDGFPWWFDVMRVVGMVGLVAPWALGITLLVQGDRSPAAWLLAVAVPVYVVTLLLPFVLAGPWVALPLVGILTSVGLALLGARAPVDVPSRVGPSAAG